MASIHLNDMAYLLEIDPLSLSEMERGIKDPSLKVILLYHMLFKESLDTLFEEEYANLNAEVIQRSKLLIARVKREHPSKSKLSIKYIERIVKSLTEDEYDFLN